MRNSDGRRTTRGFIIICVALLMVAAVPLISRARSAVSSVVVQNNSRRTIRYVYVSHVGADDWSGDQLSGNGIAPGQSASVDFSCDGEQMKVIGEDEDGCFVSTVVTCSSAGTWTITNDTPTDCG
jgi:hypothetical protein